jgi:hypothetical protein
LVACLAIRLNLCIALRLELRDAFRCVSHSATPTVADQSGMVDLLRCHVLY